MVTFATPVEFPIRETFAVTLKKAEKSSQDQLYCNPSVKPVIDSLAVVRLNDV